MGWEMRDVCVFFVCFLSCLLVAELRVFSHERKRMIISILCKEVSFCESVN